MIFGHYPEDGLSLWGEYLPASWESEMAVVQQSLDFYGANIYNGQRVRATEADLGWEATGSDLGPALTSMDWKLSPDSLYYGPKFLHERYGLPIVVTENGMANNDWIQDDGRVHDPQREQPKKSGMVFGSLTLSFCRSMPSNRTTKVADIPHLQRLTEPL